MTPTRRTPQKPTERRRNRELREVLDELVDYVRGLARDVPTMSQSELEYSQERLEWLADEVWRAVLDGAAQAPGA